MLYKAFKVIFAIVYLPPIVYSVYFKKIYFLEFYGEKTNILALLYIVLWFCVFTIIYFSVKKFKMPLKFSSRISKNLLILFSVLLVFSSIQFANSYWGTSFRHTKRFSEEGISSMLVFLLRSCAGLVCIPLLLNLERSWSPIGKKLLFGIFVGLTITINSSLQVILSALVLILLMKPRFLTSRVSLVKLLLLLPISLLVLIVGIGGKIGYEALFSMNLYESVNIWFGMILTRISTSYMAVNSIFETWPLDYTVDGWLANLGTGLNRLNYFNGSYDMMRLDTVDRRNYLILFRDFNSRAGATPFIVASSFYMSPIIGLIFTTSFTVFILRWCESFCLYRISLLQGLATVFLLLNFLEAPLNIFLIIDVIPISFLFLMFLAKINFNFMYYE